MKKCQFCAEEIQDEAIKCKHCGSMLNEPAPAAVAPAAPAASPAPDGAKATGPYVPATVAAASAGTAAAPAPRNPLAAALAAPRREPGPHPDDATVIVYEGSPSWRASFGTYFLVCLITPVVAAGTLWISAQYAASTLHQALAVLVPLAIGAVAFQITGMVRRSNRVRMTNRSVENESGVFSKKIDVMELWRIRDVRYKQSFVDRILGIAHIEVFTKDVTTPHFEIIGLPASRALFERLRDNIQIQRQSQRVMGIIE